NERPVTGNGQMTLVPDALKTRIDEAGKAVNWSAIGWQNVQGSVLNLAVRREAATMDDVVERRASKQSHVETEREAGPEVGEEWAKEDAKYGELLRIAKAVEEARREI